MRHPPNPAAYLIRSHGPITIRHPGGGRAMRVHLGAAFAVVVLAGCGRGTPDPTSVPSPDKNLRQPDDNAEPPARSTRVVQVSPPDKATDVDTRAPVQLHFSNGLKLNTLSSDSVRLLNSTGTPVPARLGSDIEG